MSPVRCNRVKITAVLGFETLATSFSLQTLLKSFSFFQGVLRVSVEETLFTE